MDPPPVYLWLKEMTTGLFPVTECAYHDDTNIPIGFMACSKVARGGLNEAGLDREIDPLYAVKTIGEVHKRGRR